MDSSKRDKNKVRTENGSSTSSRSTRRGSQPRKNEGDPSSRSTNPRRIASDSFQNGIKSRA
jgi:hypothetical protein